tara:strand:- start:947 stop:1369 length:423 start_codon:yes stop_codon:yes gene_type:complete
MVKTEIMNFISWAKTPLGMGTLALAAYYLYTETSKGKEVGDELYDAGREFFDEGKHFVKTTLDTVIDTGERLFDDSADTVEQVVSTATDTFSSVTDDVFSNSTTFINEGGFTDDTIGFNGSKSKKEEGFFDGFSAEFGEL